MHLSWHLYAFSQPHRHPPLNRWLSCCLFACLCLSASASASRCAPPFAGCWVASLGPSICWLLPLASLPLPSHMPPPLVGGGSGRLSPRAVAAKAETNTSTCLRHSNSTIIPPPAGEWVSLMAAAAVLPTQGCHNRCHCHPLHHCHQRLANVVARRAVRHCPSRHCNCRQRCPPLLCRYRRCRIPLRHCH